MAAFYTMKRKFPYYLICLVILISSCSENKKDKGSAVFEQGEGGLLYQIVDDKDTPEVGEVAFVSISYTEVTENGTHISQTGKLDPRPSMLFARMPEFKGDIHDALQYLSEGDSAVIKISTDSIKKNRGLNLFSDTSKYMVFRVKINKVINRKGSADTIYPKLIEQYQKEQTYLHKATEKEKIKKYLSRSKQSYIATPSGLLIPSGLKPIPLKPDGKFKVNYAFYTLDGKLMDTNQERLALSSGVYHPGEEYGPLEISPNNAPIPAFRAAIAVIPSGEKVKMIIPSHLAFGDYGNSKDIPAFMPLVCVFEVVGISP